MKTLLTIEDDLGEVRLLIEAAEMAAASLNASHAGPMCALLYVAEQKCRDVVDAMTEYREKTNGGDHD